MVTTEKIREDGGGLNDYIVQIGVGGIFALMVIKEVLTFILNFSRNKKNGNGKIAGDQSIEYWQAEQRKAVIEVFTTVVIPILSNQTLILNELRQANTDLHKDIIILLERQSNPRVTGVK